MANALLFKLGMVVCFWPSDFQGQNRDVRALRDSESSSVPQRDILIRPSSLRRMGDSDPAVWVRTGRVVRWNWASADEVGISRFTAAV